MSMLAGSLPGVELHPFRLTLEQMPELDSPEDWEQTLSVKAGTSPLVVALADPFCFNIQEFLEQANKFRGKPHRAQEELMQWGEVHAFDSIDEMEDVARQLKEAGIMDFNPKLVTDLGDVMRRRGGGHANIAMFNSLQDHVMTNLGVDAGTVARDLADRTFPGLRAAVERGETTIDPSKVGRAILETLNPQKRRKLTPDEKTHGESVWVIGAAS